MATTPLQPNFINNRQPTASVGQAPTVDFARLQKQFVDSAKATGDYIKSVAQLEIGFGKLNKSGIKTTETVKAVDRTINVLGVTVKGTAKELIQVGTALGVVSGAFFDLQQKSNLVIAPLKGVVEALQAVSDKSKGVEIAQAIGVDTTGIQQLELFRAGLFGNVEALKAFRTNSQTAGIAFTLNLTKLNTILKASKEDLRGVGQEARKLSKDLGGAVSAIDIVAGQYQIASAGFTKAIDSRAIAEAAGKLATVGFNDFFSTADLVTKSLRAYGLEASKAGEIAAKLNAVVEVGITTVPELAAGFGETAVVANAFGISLDQLGAAIATITTQGSSTPEALTGIEALFRTLANQSPQAAKALSELSLNGQRVKFDIATVQAKGLGNALTDVFKAANGNVEVLREIIPESRALQAALALAAQGGSLFADSLDKISQSSPTKLNDIFGEVQEDPTIKLKAITTKASELVGSLSGTYDKFTDGAVESLAKFVSVTEAIAANPVIQAIGSSFLFVADTIGKVVGVFGALGGAAFSVISTLVSINVFNNLFNGGLVKQGKLIQQSVFGLKDFGLALQQITGVDTSKSVITGLSQQLDDLKTKGAALELTNPKDNAAIEENKKNINEITKALREVRRESVKPITVATNGLKEAKKEVLELQQQLNALGADDASRAGLLNKQRDAIGKVGEQRLAVEQAIQKAERDGVQTREQGNNRRKKANQVVSDVAGATPDQAVFNQGLQRSNVSEIKQRLKDEQELVKKGEGNVAIQRNLAASLLQVQAGSAGVINAQGQLETQYRKTGGVGQALALGTVKNYERLTRSIGSTRASVSELDKSFRLAQASESIGNFGQAAGKLFSSTGAGLNLLLGGLKNTIGATAKFGASLLADFVNPLTVGFAAFTIGKQLFDEYNKGLEIQQDTAQKFADSENKRTEAIRNTTKAIEEQARITALVAGGSTDKEARARVTEEKQEADLRKQSGTVTGDRRSRLQTQIASRDFRSANTFATEELGKLRDNKLGIGTDNGAAKAQADFIKGETIGLTAAFSVGGAVAGAKFGAALGSTIPGLGTLLGAAAGAAIGLAVSQIGANLAKGNAIDKIESEFTARRKNELETKFKVNESATPQERARRQKKVDDNLAVDKIGFRGAVSQAGLDDNVIQELINSKEDTFKGTGAVLKKLQSDITDNNKLLTQVDKSFKDNKVPDGLFENDDLTQKVNALLAGTRATSVNDLALVDADLKGRIESLKVTQEIANSRFEEAKNSGVKGAADSFKRQSEQIGAQIEQFSQFSVKLKPKLELSNKDVQNALKNGQGAVGAISIKEQTSVTTSIEALKKALATNETTDRNSIVNNIQTLGASLETLAEIDPTKTTQIIKDVRDLLSSKDVLKLDSQQIVALQNIVAANTTKLAQEKISKFEALARRVQGIAGSTDAATARTGQEAQAEAELALLDVRIEAQRQLVNDTQGAAAKERANNDLLQLQLDKKNKTVDARIQKELNAANLVFEREKARFDLQKAALELTKSDLDLKKQIFEQFGLQTEGVDTDLVKNKLEQLQADTAKQRAEISKERADLVRIQQAGLEQQKALLAIPQPQITNKQTVEEKKLDTKPFADAREAINKREKELVEATNTRGDLSKDEAQREVRLTEIKQQASDERQKIAVAEYNAAADLRAAQAKEENALNNKATPGARRLEDGGILVRIGNPVTDAITDQQKEELARLDARNKAIDDQLKKQQQALQFEIDLAEAYNAVVKPLERQSKLLQDSLVSTQQVLATTQQLNPLYVSQEALQGSIQTNAALQIVGAKRVLDVEKQKLEIQEKLLAKNGLLTAEVKKQLDDQKVLLDNNFKQQVVAIQFEAKQSSIDAFTKKLQSGIEQKLKALDLQKSGLQTFADSFEDEDSKDGEKAKKLAGALAINIAVQQAALAEQLLKTEQEKTLNQLKQNDLQLQFLDIQLKVQASQTKDKELLDSIASARGSISGLRANIGQELTNAPQQFAKEQELQRKQSLLGVSSASLQFTKQFDPKNLKTEQDSFLRQNSLDLNQSLGATGVNSAVGSLVQQSAANQREFAAVTQQQKQQSAATQAPVRREADGSISNQPVNYTVNVNVSGTNATPAEIGKVVRQEMLNTTKELLRK